MSFHAKLFLTALFGLFLSAAPARCYGTPYVDEGENLPLSFFIKPIPMRVPYPPEMLELIFRYLPLKEAHHVRQVCKEFNLILSSDEYLKLFSIAKKLHFIQIINRDSSLTGILSSYPLSCLDYPLDALEILDLTNNEHPFPKGLFKEMSRLRALTLDSNKRPLLPSVFVDTPGLTDLYLDHNTTPLPHNLFSSMSNIRELSLNHSTEPLPKGLFSPLINLQKLLIEGTQIDPDDLASLREQGVVIFE